MPLFQVALGEQWARLPPEVQALHDVQTVSRYRGMAEVIRGRSWVARAAAWLAGFPPAGQGVPVILTMAKVEDGEEWVRDFGGRKFRSLCHASPLPGHSREQIGLFTFEMALPVTDSGLSLEVCRGWLWRVPMPRFLLPVSVAREYAADGRYRFDISAFAPLKGGLIVRYRGWLEPDRT